MQSSMDEKIRAIFNEMAVYKDFKKSSFFLSLSLPAFMRDWLLRKFEDTDGNYDINRIRDFTRKFMPSRDEWTSIKNRIILEGERVKILTKISADIDIKTQEISFELPAFSLGFKDTYISPETWRKYSGELSAGREIWGVIELGYRFPEGKSQGKIELVSFSPFCPYTVSAEYYREARKEFTVYEWEDLLLGAIDYNAAGYVDEEQKLSMLTRLLPFIEKRLNMIELAPKGTGKSYVFGNVSRYGWLSSGGIMTRAKMFYDLSRSREGLITGYDFVVLDEVQTITFSNTDEMRAALKGYLEQGNFTVGGYKGVSDAGVVLCGNIAIEAMTREGANMFAGLPKVFHESALIERFHGFLKGWNIPRMNDDLKIHGWALNSEYFGSVMHELRSDITYRGIVDELIAVPKGADTRDTEAVKRISTAYLKLLFPHVKTANDITAYDFRRYCLDRAIDMRGMIRTQAGILDAEYRNKPMPIFGVRS
ncbi:MAG: BREX system Lon protease-like protein BrxL [Synergistaceae bacterium]|nr:BREX system Lon protease-like protein BrxL [Synergistaceae bacterium]